VEITEELGNWFEIKLADGNSGWVQKPILEKI
jgi:SH3-like domain-containing protein